MVMLRPVGTYGHLHGENIQSSYLFSPVMMKLEPRKKKEKRKRDKKAFHRLRCHALDLFYRRMHTVAAVWRL